MVFLVPSTSFVSFFTSFLVFLLCKKKQSKKTKKEVKQLKLCLKDTVVVFFVKILTALDHADRLMRTTFKPSFSCLTSFLVKKKMTRFFYKEGIRDTKKEVKKLKILLFFF